jgi:hypothetical protein
MAFAAMHVLHMLIPTHAMRVGLAFTMAVAMDTWGMVACGE